ncbi:MAG: hypothetical protein EHM23_05360 [Acidobacteria bacterium]|nr:MAG: hypothetical protein EHM23_05360 [Acidobacteriota bacterium]
MRRIVLLMFVCVSLPSGLAWRCPETDPARASKGWLSRIHCDMKGLRPGGDRFLFLPEDGELVEVFFKEMPEWLSGTKLPARVNLRSVTDRGRLMATVGPADGPGQKTVQFGSKPWIVILCKFAGDDSEPTTVSFFEALFGSEYPGLDHYWREVSGGRINLAGTRVIGWYRLPWTRAQYLASHPGHMDTRRAFIDATAAADKDVYFPSYTGIALVFNNLFGTETPGPSQTLAFGGDIVTTLDGITRTWGVTWVPGNHRYYAFGHEAVGFHQAQAHEMGHGMGLPHSSAAYGQTYDNFWDVMSYWATEISHPEFGFLGPHTIAFHKDLLGWIPADEKITIAPGEQRTVELAAVSTTTGVRLLEAPIGGSTSRYYTVETRKRVGYDAGLVADAVIIHDIDLYRTQVNGNFGTFPLPAHVVDADMNGYTGDEGSIWHPGEAFTDAPNGIAVSVGRQTDTGYQVTVSNNAQAFSDFVSGAGTVSTLFLLNPSPSHSVEGSVRMSGPTGESLSLKVNGSATNGEFEIAVPPQGVRLFSADGSGPLVLGSVALGSSSPIAASVLFEGQAGSAAVPGQMLPRNSALLPCLTGGPAGFRSGVAVSNPSDGLLVLHLGLRDSEGLILESDKTLTIEPHGQKAAYVDELLANSPGDPGTPGSTVLEITSEDPFNALGLLTGSGFFATLPVAQTSDQPSAGRTGVVTTIAGQPENPGSADGPVEIATFSSPRDVALGTDGSIYVAEYGNHAIRKITPGGTVETVAGQKGVRGSKDGVGTEAQFYQCSGLCTDKAGNIYVADSGNHTIRRISPAGDVSTVAGLAGSYGSSDGEGSEARFWRPRGIDVDASGNLYVCDQSNHTIRKITPDGSVNTIAGRAGEVGSQDGPGNLARFNSPWYLDIDPQGFVYVSDFENSVLRRIDQDGNVMTVAGIAGKHGYFDAGPGQSRFGWPRGVAADSAGRIYVGDRYLLRELDTRGHLRTLAGFSDTYASPLSPAGLTTDGAGTAARFSQLFGLAASPSGDVYTADLGNHTIRKIEIRDNFYTSHFPHLADGEGLTSALILINPSEDQSATGTIRLYDQAGLPFTAVMNGVVVSGAVSFTIPSKGIRVFATSGSGPVVTGSVTVDSDVALAGTLLYSSPFGVAGVPSSGPGLRLMIPVETDKEAGIRTGAALSNPETTAVDVTLSLRDQEGLVVSETSTVLPPHGKIARFCDELFQTKVGENGDRFVGSLEIRASHAVSAVGLRVTSKESAALPSYVEP